MEDCIFCKIVKGEIPNNTVYEDDDFLAFLDIAPTNKGHTLVITKEHYETLTDLPEEVLTALALRVQMIARAVEDGVESDGYNVFCNNYPAAGQIVPHMHFHIVPRFDGDGIKFDWPHQQYEEGEDKNFLEKITSFLNG